MPDPYPPGCYAVILAARQSSQRLPGKATVELAPGLPVLSQIIYRWQESARNPTIVVTTTNAAADDAIERIAERAGVPCSRGDPTNVVAQFDTAVRRYAPNAQYIARALADNPLVDVDLADYRLDKLREADADGLWYGAEFDSGCQLRALHERITYAGTTDVWSRRMWDEVASQSAGSQLEHPGAYFWDTLHERGRRVRLLALPRDEYISTGFDTPPQRTELDEPADLAMFRAVWQGWLDDGNVLPCVPTLWALRWLASHPQAARLNRSVALKTMSAVGVKKSRRARICTNCMAQTGQISDEGLEQRCQRCGNVSTFFHANPKRRAR